LNKIYGEGETAVNALRDVSFSVKKGELLLIVGSSGSGKSTLLNMIGLLDRPTSGKVFLDGIDTTTLNDNELSSFRNSKLGFVFQFANLLSDLTVLENILLPRKIQRTNENSVDEAKKYATIICMRHTVRELQFKVLIEQGGDGIYVASVPELQGCYTQGNTLEEVRKRIKEVTALVLEASTSTVGVPTISL